MNKDDERPELSEDEELKRKARALMTLSLRILTGCDKLKTDGSENGSSTGATEE